MVNGKAAMMVNIQPNKHTCCGQTKFYTTGAFHGQTSCVGKCYICDKPYLFEPRKITIDKKGESK